MMVFGSTLVCGLDYLDIIEQIYHTNGAVINAYVLVFFTMLVLYVKGKLSAKLLNAVSMIMAW